MSIWIDSANLDEIQSAMSCGWVTGVTTNPLLLAKANTPVPRLLEQIRDVTTGPVFYQVVSTAVESMQHEAELAATLLGDRLVLKVAPTQTGIDLIKTHPQYRYCPTAIFSPAQALVVRELNCRYLAIYVNRATRLSGDGITLLAEIADLLADYPTEVLAASLKSPSEVVAAVKAGAHHVTLPYAVLDTMLNDPHSRSALEAFENQGCGLLP